MTTDQPLSQSVDRASAAAILAHLTACDTGFQPRLSDRVNLADYSAKLAEHAIRHELWEGDRLVGLVTVYANAPDRGTAFVSNVSLLPEHQGKGLARLLLSAGVDTARVLGFARVALQVGAGNTPARSLYDRQGFKTVADRDGMIDMVLILKENLG